MREGHEIFANHPLELVAAEIRFPYAPRLSRHDVVEDLLDIFGVDLPNFEPPEPVAQTATHGSADLRKDSPLFRFYDRSYTTAVTITPASVALETTNYSGFDNFLELIRNVAESVFSVGRVSIIRRVGLRYLNEIRVPAEIEDVREWNGWVNPNLMGPVELGDLKPERYEGVINYSIAPHRNLLFRFGALPKGTVVRETALRRRRRPEAGPLFVLDFDAYCHPPRDRAPAVDLDTLATIFQELHDPTEAAFNSVVSDKLRDVFRGKL